MPKLILRLLQHKTGVLLVWHLASAAECNGAMHRADPLSHNQEDLASCGPPSPQTRRPAPAILCTWLLFRHSLRLWHVL